MHRFWVQSSIRQSAEIALDPSEARHACQVLRLHPSDPCELIGNGERWRGEILSLSSVDGTVRAVDPLPSTEPHLRITLFQGLPKGDKMELIIQKAVELGADSVVPVTMERCISKLDPKDVIKKQERWQRIATEACKQSGRCSLPKVYPLVSVRSLPELLKSYDASLVPWEEAKGYSLRSFANEHAEVHSLAVIIGPEGGITSDEIATMMEAGALPVTLGPRILRTETAGMAAIAALMCLYGEMEGMP